MKKRKILIIVLIVLVAILAGYIGLEKYNDWELEKDLEVYQAGMQAGYEQAIIQVMQQVSTCQTVPLYAGNVTLNVVAVECLQQQG